MSSGLIHDIKYFFCLAASAGNPSGSVKRIIMLQKSLFSRLASKQTVCEPAWSIAHWIYAQLKFKATE